MMRQPVDVLVVDDNDIVRQHLVSVLNLEGFTTREVVDGWAALEALDNFEPAVMITDILMPNMEGIELILKAKARAMEGRLKIIAISGGSPSLQYDFLPVARRAGADAVLQKPFRNADLTRLLRSMIDRPY